MVFSATLRRAAAQNAGSYRSPHFAPKYQTAPQINGVSVRQLPTYGRIAGAFGVATGVFLVFFFGEVPRVRNDILRRLPFFDTYFDRSLAPEDNPF